jgi:hypothetical protein
MNDPRAIRSSARLRRPERATRCALLALGAILVAGCAMELDTEYGTSTNRFRSTSVNGVDVLAGMFVDAGHEVSSRSVLITASMDHVQTIVWFPDDGTAPSEEVCDWFDEWLAFGTDRTLIYVGRSFDSALPYWREMTSLAPEGQKKLYRERQRMARGGASPAGAVGSSELKCPWFEIEPGSLHKVKELDGPWSRGIDSGQADVWMGDQLVPEVRARNLLTSGDETIVWRHTRGDWDGGKLIAVANGSFLLNLPLVNHEHRLLAGKLIDAVGEPGRVVFLRSGRGGPPIDPETGSALARLFGAWPLGAILLQLAVLGVIFCFARWPIFGRAKVPPTETTSDFGHHVDAVGELLKRTRDRAYARSKLPDASEATKGDAGGAHL